MNLKCKKECSSFYSINCHIKYHNKPWVKINRGALNAVGNYKLA